LAARSQSNNLSRVGFRPSIPRLARAFRRLSAGSTRSLSAALVARFDAAEGDGSIVSLCSGIQTTSGPLEIEPSPAPRISQPANNATDVDASTTFSWDNYANGVHLLSLSPATDSDAPSLFIVTDETSATLPELTGLGFSLSADTDYHLRVIGVGPASGIDDAASNRWADIVS